jgi:hypothetical protein
MLLLQISGKGSEQEQEQEQECPICYETPEFSTVTTKCGHTFCFDCYKKHVESRGEYSHKCPCCRAPISREREEEQDESEAEGPVEYVYEIESEEEEVEYTIETYDLSEKGLSDGPQDFLVQEFSSTHVMSDYLRLYKTLAELSIGGLPYCLLSSDDAARYRCSRSE